MNRVQVVGANGGGVAYSRGSVIPWKKRIDEGFYKQKGGGFDMGPGGIFGTPKQRGGGWFDGLSQGMFGVKQTRGKKKRPPLGAGKRKQKGGFSRVIAHMERRKKQKGGGWFARGFTGFSGATRGKNLEIENRRLQKEREQKRKQKGGGVGMSPGSWLPIPPRNQRGGGWFDGLSQGMFGIKQTRGKKKRKPAVIHSAATSYPQKGGGGKYGGFKGFFENPFHVKEKLGVGNKGKKQKGGVLGLGKLEKWYGGKSKKEQGEIDAWAAKNL